MSKEEQPDVSLTVHYIFGIKLVFLFIFIIAIFSVLFVRPGPYRYKYYGRSTLVFRSYRIDRLTGNVQEYDAGRWVKYTRHPINRHD